MENSATSKFEAVGDQELLRSNWWPEWRKCHRSRLYFKFSALCSMISIKRYCKLLLNCNVLGDALIRD